MTGLDNNFREQHGRHTAEDQGDLQNPDIGVLYDESRRERTVRASPGRAQVR